LGGEHLLYAAIVLVLLAVLNRRLQNVSFGFRFSCLLLFLVGAAPVASEWTGQYLVPQPTRYHHELGMAMVLTLSGPGRVIPRDPAIEAAVLLGEQRFADVGCAGCHVPALPLTGNGRVFVEPNPFNPPGNLRPGDAPALSVDLNDKVLPSPRLEADKRTGITWVPAFTDLKLHDITYGADDPNRETLNMHFAAGSVEFFAGNGRFLTKKLWGAANEPPYFHHGKYTTMREAILAHYGEADASRLAFEGLSSHEQDSIIEFLKTLQVLPPGTKFLIVDEKFHRRQWPPGNLVMAR
jgi:hypothetical protein